MKRLTSLLEEITAQENQRRVGQSGRPTSLYEAGGTGERPGPPAAASRDEAIETGEEPTAEERARRRPARNPRPSRSGPQSTTAQHIRATLRNPASFRTAVLIREILDPPMSRRPRRTNR